MSLAKKIRLVLANGNGPPENDVAPPPERPKVTPLTDYPPSVSDIIEDVNKYSVNHFGFFRPSMLFGCERQNVFHYLKAPSHPQKQDPRMIRILDNGTAVHEVIQRYLGGHKDWWFVREAPVFARLNGAWVKGSCDGILIRRSDLYRFAVEIKTINHNEFLKLTKPKPKHVQQATVYCAMNRVQWIVILYWDKDKQNFKEFPVRYDPKVWNKIKDRVAMLKTMVDAAGGFGASHDARKIDSTKLPKYNPSTCDPTFCEFVRFCRAKGAPV